MGLALYPEHVFQRMDVRVRLSQQLLQLGVLALQITQPHRLAALQPAEPCSPLVEGRFAEAPLPAQF